MKLVFLMLGSAIALSAVAVQFAPVTYVDNAASNALRQAKGYADGATNAVAQALRGEIGAATNGVPEALASHASSLSSLSSSLSAHTNRTDNPHGVTAAQVGAYTKAQADASVAASVAAATNGLASSESMDGIAAEVAGKANAASVYTKAQIDAKGFLTAHQPLTNCATKAELAAKQDRPAAPVTASALAYRADCAAISVSVAASASLVAELAGWTEGQAQTALVTLAAGASVDSGVRLVGYGSWPTNRFLASCVRVGALVYVTPVTALSE